MIKDPLILEIHTEGQCVWNEGEENHIFAVTNEELENICNPVVFEEELSKEEEKKNLFDFFSKKYPYEHVTKITCHAGILKPYKFSCTWEL